ncbi:DNA cytosine methyltransferase [Brevibacillus brevis]|uniref:DNA cytosine methyltransferase n=1 Tax=Brevibacillus brevis TaxID=1393 RepID=UPI000D114184|nr:DNA cytosine methyltransferase [Brevibacillus brevis]PSJ63543.1 DNA cytosine methyltransferase [Brevibacillus brevis]RED33850.1 DNA (cytosine-5)-methyltransferase 1 [Brevibacillus brevis]GEC93341.1 DNA methyltransferase [Brevibacillus brevis]VEF92580.1 Modification methylase HaeIII [Brevibacillus brevis]
MKKLSVIDLFAGAGGLSLGFQQTNKVDIKAAVENNKYAKKSYERNHPQNVTIYNDIRQVDYDELTERYGEIDIVIGGPPCQGFSNANRQKNELISTNNQLVKEYIRAIQELAPKAFVMENVKMMGSSKHKFFLLENEHEEIIDELKILPIEEKVTLGQVNILSQHLVDFLKEQEDLNLRLYLLDSKELLSKFNSFIRNRNNISQYLSKNLSFLKKVLKKWDSYHQCYWNNRYREIWFNVKEMLEIFIQLGSINPDFINYLGIITETQKILWKKDEIISNGIELVDIDIDAHDVFAFLKTYNVLEYIERKLESLGYITDKKILNAADFGVPQIRERLFLIGVRDELLNGKEVQLPQKVLGTEEYFTAFHAFSDLEHIIPDKNVSTNYKIKNLLNTDHPLTRYLNGDVQELYNHIITDSTETALERFKALGQGENFHDLKEEQKSTYSDPGRTQNTVYQRLQYDSPSGTVLNVRKSMWIHPKLDRAVSIREAARLQSFPDSYVFCGTKDAQYQQIGNAVPPLLARAVAEKVLELLGVEVEEKLSHLIGKHTNVLYCE